MVVLLSMHRRAKTSVVCECGYYGALLESAIYQDGTLSESFSLEWFAGSVRDARSR